MDDSFRENPYQSPAEIDDRPRLTKGPVSSLRLRGTLKSFRTLMHTLGGIWIGLATLVSLGLLVLLSADPEPLILIVVAIPAVLWMGLGIATCFKQMWAAYIGLGLSYLSVVGNLLQLNLCALVVLVPTIVIAHYAISKAGELKRAGIPLNMHPRQLQMPKENPFAQPFRPDFEGIDFDD